MGGVGLNSGFRILGVALRAFGFRVWGLGFMVLGFS